MTALSVINESTVIGDTDVQAMIPAFTQQWNVDLKQYWNVDTAAFSFLPKPQTPPTGAWWVVFLDDSDQASALAYHDLTNEGLPIAKIFVKTIEADKSSLSVGATHELCEMAVDPWLNSAFQDPQGSFWAGEVCDPVEDDSYGYPIGQILVTDFVTPNWFAHAQAQSAIDFKGHAKAAFAVLSGGYAQKFDPTQGWQQISGARAQTDARSMHPANGSRRERRIRQAKQRLVRSEVRWERRR
jgi:hypothetical protein